MSEDGRYEGEVDHRPGRGEERWVGFEEDGGRGAVG